MNRVLRMLSAELMSLSDVDQYGPFLLLFARIGRRNLPHASFCIFSKLFEANAQDNYSCSRFLSNSATPIRFAADSARKWLPCYVGNHARDFVARVRRI